MRRKAEPTLRSEKEKLHPLSVTGLNAKYRFMLFGIVYNLSGRTSKILAAFGTIAYLLGMWFCSVYAVSANTMKNIYAGEWSVFEGSPTMSFLMDQILNTTAVMFVLDLLIIWVLISFLVCWKSPRKTRHGRWLFDMFLHLTFLPWVSGFAGFACWMVIRKSFDDNPPLFIVSCITIPLFFLYVAFVVAVMFVNSITLINPTSQFASWFQGKTCLLTLCDAAMAACYFQYTRMNVHVFQAICCIFVIIQLTVIIILLSRLPFVSVFYNEFYATKYTVMLINNVFSVISYYYLKHMRLFTFAVIPFISVFIWIIYHGIVRRRLFMQEKILGQLELDVDNGTLQEIQTSLEAVKTEKQYRFFIQTGLIFGNRAICCEPFIEYVLDKFPKSEWLVSYVIFIYATLRVVNSDVYRFALHLLSLDVFGFSCQNLLFQVIYCSMQMSKMESPIIVRELDSYKLMFYNFTVVHRLFWLSSTHASLSSFRVSLFRVIRMYQDLRNRINELAELYPFSTTVLFHKTVFESDCNYDYREASYCFKKAMYMVIHGLNYVTSTFYQGYNMLMHTTRRMVGKFEFVDTGEYVFISMNNEHEKAVRQTTEYSTKDKTFNAMTHWYKIHKKDVHPRFNILNKQIACMKVSIVMTICVFFIMFVMNIHFGSLLAGDVASYVELKDIINTTVAFRYHTNVALLQSSAIYHCWDGTYWNITDEVETDQDEIELYTQQLRLTTLTLYMLRCRYDRAEQFAGLINSAQAENCDGTPCDFRYLFGRVFQMLRFSYENRDEAKQFLNEKHEQLYEFGPKLNSLFDKIYESLKKELQKYVIRDRMSPIYGGVLCGIIVLFWLSCVISFQVTVNESIFVLYSIVKTVQPPVAKHISLVYESLTRTSQRQFKGTWNKDPALVIIMLTLSVILLLTFPVAEFIAFATVNATVTVPESLPPQAYLNPNNEFMFAMKAKNALALNTSEFMAKLNMTQLNMYFGDDWLSEYKSLSVDFELWDRLSVFYDNVSFDLILWIAVVLAVASLILFILHLVFLFRVHGNLRNSRRVFNYIPLIATRTNPTIRNLSFGEQITAKDVKSFVNALEKEPDAFESFCVIYFGDNGRVVMVKGHPADYIGFTPKHIDQVREFCENYADTPEHVPKFFDHEEEFTKLYISYEGNSKYLFTFTNEQTLMIEDISDTYSLAEQDKIIEAVANEITAVQNTKLEDIPQSITVVATLHTSDPDAVCNVFGTKMTVYDRRNGRVVLACEQAKANEVVNLLINNGRSLTPVSIVCDIGEMKVNPIDQKGYAMKPRCYGELYSRLTLLADMTPIGRVLISKGAIDCASVEIPQATFEENDFGNFAVL